MIVYFQLFESSGKNYILGRIIKENEAYTIPANSYVWYTGFNTQQDFNDTYFGLFNSNSDQVDSWFGSNFISVNGQFVTLMLFDPTKTDLSQLFPNFYN